MQAAWTLLDLDKSFVPEVRRAVAGWPDDAPYPAGRVREFLARWDELAQARGTVAAASDPGSDPPVDPARVLTAVHTLLFNGDDTDGPRLLTLIDSDGFADLFDRIDRARADELSMELRGGLHWRLPEGATDPRHAAALERLPGLRTGRA